jgi:ATP-dependent DNA helicase
MDSKKGALNASASKSTRGPAKQSGRGRKRLRVQDDADLSDDGKCSSKRKKLDSSQSQPQTAANEKRQPALVTGAKLKDYQLEGVEWMISLDQNGISGILGEWVFNQAVPPHSQILESPIYSYTILVLRICFVYLHGY